MNIILHNLIMKRVEDERERQNMKWGVQNHPDRSVICREGRLDFYDISTADHLRHMCEFRMKKGYGAWPDILLEEVAEAIEAAINGDTNNLKEELIQVAAVCVQWVECIERRGE